jgi:hypothetical protein
MHGSEKRQEDFGARRFRNILALVRRRGLAAWREAFVSAWTMTAQAGMPALRRAEIEHHFPSGRG